MERRDFLVNSAALAGAAALGQNLGASDVRANVITLQAIGAAMATLKDGMTPAAVSNTVATVSRRLGGQSDGGLVIFGKYSAFPHGTVRLQGARSAASHWPWHRTGWPRVDQLCAR